MAAGQEQTKPRPLTIPQYRRVLEEYWEAAEALAESRDEQAQAVARAFRWLRTVRPGGV